MFEFDFKKSGRKCIVSGRSFEVGEEYISLLIENDGELVRQDVASDQWNGPSEECVGWWKSKVPDLAQGRVYLAPRDVLMSLSLIHI